jgi:predicted PurR-regulated permease PerM
MMRGNRSVTVLAVIAIIFLLDQGAPFFIPLFLSLLISYALSPVVDAIARVLRWRVASAALVVLAVLGLVGASAWA